MFKNFLQFVMIFCFLILAINALAVTEGITQETATQTERIISKKTYGTNKDKIKKTFKYESNNKAFIVETKYTCEGKNFYSPSKCSVTCALKKAAGEVIWESNLDIRFMMEALVADNGSSTVIVDSIYEDEIAPDTTGYIFLDKHGKIVGKYYYTEPVEGVFSKFTLSSNGKYFGVVTHKGITIFDTSNGKLLWEKTIDQIMPDYIKFSETGEYLLLSLKKIEGSDSTNSSFLNLFNNKGMKLWEEKIPYLREVALSINGTEIFVTTKTHKIHYKMEKKKVTKISQEEVNKK